MIELDLFYNKATVAIREKQADYLKRQRSQPFPQELPKLEEKTAFEYSQLFFWDKFIYRWQLRKARKRYKKALKRQKMPVDEKLIKGYNAGMECALRELEGVYKAFSKELESLDN